MLNSFRVLAKGGLQKPRPSKIVLFFCFCNFLECSNTTCIINSRKQEKRKKRMIWRSGEVFGASYAQSSVIFLRFCCFLLIIFGLFLHNSPPLTNHIFRCAVYWRREFLDVFSLDNFSSSAKLHLKI